MRWTPEAGHAPRGFAGATGELADVRLVLVCAEPGDPQAWERYDGRSGEDLLRATHDFTYASFRDGTDQFHRNVRLILDMCFPGGACDEQLEQAWITESVLCSARVESGSVSAAAARTCRSTYLQRELDLLPNAVVVALGAKARDRMRGIKGEVVDAVAAAPPGCNRRDARASWKAAAARVRDTASGAGVSCTVASAATVNGTDAPVGIGPPFVDAMLPDGSRLHVVIPDLASSVRGPGPGETVNLF